MMNKTQVETHLEKANRLYGELFRHLSAYSFMYEVDEQHRINNERQTYSFQNLKNPSLHRDDMIAVCGVIRDFRDYCTKSLRTQGVPDSKNIVINFIKSNIDICICSDIANAEKHMGTEPGKRWTQGFIPRLSEPGIEIDGLKALHQITFSGNDILFNLSQDNGVKIPLYIIDEFNARRDDAYEVVFRAKSAWISFCEKYSLI